LILKKENIEVRFSDKSTEIRIYYKKKYVSTYSVLSTISWEHKKEKAKLILDKTHRGEDMGMYGAFQDKMKQIDNNNNNYGNFKFMMFIVIATIILEVIDAKK